MQNDNIDFLRDAALWTAAVSISLFVLAHLYGRLRKRRLDHELIESFPSIYRVISPPSDEHCVLKAEGALIEVGDYGWEAERVSKNDLIYLHGLNDKWQVVWYAGFRPEQVEVVGPKPRSQYYIFPYWVKANIPKCPFAVNKFQHGAYKSAHFGFPVQIRNNWIQGRRVARASANR